MTGLHEKLSADAVRPHVDSFVFDMLVGDAFHKEKITFGTLEAFIKKLDADYPQCGEACSLPVEHASYADLAKRVKELEESIAHIEQFLADATTNPSAICLGTNRPGSPDSMASDEYVNWMLHDEDPDELRLATVRSPLPRCTVQRH